MNVLSSRSLFPPSTSYLISRSLHTSLRHLAPPQDASNPSSSTLGPRPSSSETPWTNVDLPPPSSSSPKPPSTPPRQPLPSITLSPSPAPKSTAPPLRVPRFQDIILTTPFPTPDSKRIDPRARKFVEEMTDRAKTMDEQAVWDHVSVLTQHPEPHTYEGEDVRGGQMGWGRVWKAGIVSRLRFPLCDLVVEHELINVNNLSRRPSVLAQPSSPGSELGRRTGRARSLLTNINKPSSPNPPLSLLPHPPLISPTSLALPPHLPFLPSPLPRPSSPTSTLTAAPSPFSSSSAPSPSSRPPLPLALPSPTRSLPPKPPSAPSTPTSPAGPSSSTSATRCFRCPGSSRTELLSAERSSIRVLFSSPGTLCCLLCSGTELGSRLGGVTSV
jgi:hypothetical protein